MQAIRLPERPFATALTLASYTFASEWFWECRRVNLLGNKQHERSMERSLFSVVHAMRNGEKRRIRNRAHRPGNRTNGLSVCSPVCHVSSHSYRLDKQ